jgi:tetratricopeptide (TPR) repeat protein
MKTENLLRLVLFTLFFLLIVPYTASQAGRGTARINGVVVDENSNPISSAKIVIQLQENEEIKRQTTSNKNGEWAILGLGTGMWRVIVSAEGYVQTYVDVYVRQLERNPKITLTLKKIQKIDEVVLQEDAFLSILEQANELVAEKKYDEAVATYEQVLEKNPELYQVHLSIGNCYIAKGELDKACEEYGKALEQSQKDESRGKEMAAKALSGMGECYLKKGDFESAQQYFRQSIDSYPENEIIPYNVGEICFANQKIDDAIHYFEQASQIKADWPPPYLKLGYSFLNKGDYDKAILNFKKFLELDPQSPEAPTIRNTIEYLEKIKK